MHRKGREDMKSALAVQKFDSLLFILPFSKLTDQIPNVRHNGLFPVCFMAN